MHANRWEYKVEDLKVGFMFNALKPEHMTEVLNHSGMQGWELINVVTIGGTTKLFFKRQR
jgi:hypothetical protein